MRPASRAGLICALALCGSGCIRSGLEPWSPGASDRDACACDERDGDPDGEPDADGGAEAGADSDLDGDLEAEPDGGPDGDLDGWDAGPCDEDPCRLVAPQCGCRPGLACQRVGAADSPRECVSPGPLGFLEPCLGVGECATAHGCVKVLDRVGVCLPYCYGSEDCPPETICVETAGATEPIGLCAAMCDPLLGPPCLAPTACIALHVRDLDDGAVVPTATCGDDRSLPALGERCTDLCGQGTVCVAGTCEQVCVPTTVCPARRTCHPIEGWTMWGLDYGVCL